MSAEETITIHRNTALDYLRVVSFVAVVLLHSSSQNWAVADVNTLEWQVFNVGDSISRWCVPMFVMISGSIFLNRDISRIQLYEKYILRMSTAFLFWSFFYMCFEQGTRTERVVAFIKGHYHMWFILMIVGLYMCLPFIKIIAGSKERTKYFLVLGFLFSFIFPTIINILKDLGSEMLVEVAKAIEADIGKMEIHMVLGYTSYYMLGYIITNIKMTKKQRYTIYLLGIIGFTYTVFMSRYISLWRQAPCSNYYNYLSVNVLLETVAVYTWFQYHTYPNIRINYAVSKLAKYSFGAYIVHLFILERLSVIGVNSLMFSPVKSIICLVVLVSILSFVISALMNQIPLVNKYIV